VSTTSTADLTYRLVSSTNAFARFEGSAAAVALTVITGELGMVFGARYNPSLP
jgi:hypothetical protein